jgi:hypothetical protein
LGDATQINVSVVGHFAQGNKNQFLPEYSFKLTKPARRQFSKKLPKFVFSDIDLVLVGNWDQIPFEVVRRGIEQKNLAKPGSLQLLEHATVTIDLCRLEHRYQREWIVQGILKTHLHVSPISH